MTNDQIIIYQTPNGETAIDVKLHGENIRLTQAQPVDLFQSGKANISEHVKDIYSSEELSPAATVRKFRTVQQQDKRRIKRDYYNLDTVIHYSEAALLTHDNSYF